MRYVLKFICLTVFLVTGYVKAENFKYLLEHTTQGIKSAEVISSRLNHAKSFFDSKVKVITDKGNIYLVVDEDIVESDYFEYLVNSIGELEAFTTKQSEHDVWFTDENIVNTGFSKSSVDFSVSPETVQVTNQLFEKYKGQLITILLDGELLLRAKLNAPLSKHFRINPVTIAKPEYVSILLKYGSLAERVYLTKVH